MTVKTKDHSFSSFQNFPKSEMPRERFINMGAENVSNAELLAIILRTGTKEDSAISLAHKLLQYFGNLRKLKQASVLEISNIKGIGEAKAIQILASIELGMRLSREPTEERFTIRSPQDCADFMMEEMRYLQQEHFVCLFLNIKNQIIFKKTIFIGSLNSSIVHPREIFHQAIRHSAASIICLHNHPSGEISPSKEDIEVTKRLHECGKIMGIDLLDHSAHCS